MGRLTSMRERGNLSSADGSRLPAGIVPKRPVGRRGSR
jgi:hypothetical protein